jgi:flagellin-like protein
VRRLSKPRLRRARALRGKRGVSEVLGTILILALTVVLFSSIFFFVSTFPKPATQPASQFQGQLYYVNQGTKTYVNYLKITHLAGPTIYAFNTQIYVVSQAHPQNTTAIYSLSSGGILGTGASWGVGQTWNLSLLSTDHLSTPDNITVTVVSQGNVVYRQTLPGTNPTIPPIFEAYGDTPTNPQINATFGIFVEIGDPFLATTSKLVYLNLTTPGLSCGTALTTYPASTGEYRFAYNSTTGYWVVSGCSAPTAGTYYVTAWVTDSNPIQVQQNSIIFAIVVGSSSSGGGGGGSSGGCSVAYTAVATDSPKTVTDSKAVVLYMNVTVLASSTPTGNACAWIYFSGNYTGTVTKNEGTYTATNPTQVSDAIMQVGLTSPGITTELTASWTAPTASCGTGHTTCTGTATITFTISYASGATGAATVVWTINY